jgi:hypothetical protein
MQRIDTSRAVPVRFTIVLSELQHSFLLNKADMDMVTPAVWLRNAIDNHKQIPRGIKETLPLDKKGLCGRKINLTVSDEMNQYLVMGSKALKMTRGDFVAHILNTYLEEYLPIQHRIPGLGESHGIDSSAQ